MAKGFYLYHNGLYTPVSDTILFYGKSQNISGISKISTKRKKTSPFQINRFKTAENKTDSKFMYGVM